MALHVSAAQLRDELTKLWPLISYGRLVVVEGVHRPAVLLRPLQRDDRGQRITITRFRRQLHRILREVQREPVVVTADGLPYFWVGPAPDEIPESAEDQRELLRLMTAIW
jgi:hypothetical protein